MENLCLTEVSLSDILADDDLSALFTMPIATREVVLLSIDVCL
jgi:hypothetical protein